MTNLIHTLITVTTLLTTNVTETDNHTGCSMCDGIRKNHWAVYHTCDKVGIPYSPATEKQVYYRVERETTYRFDLLGCEKVLTEAKLVTNWTRFYKLTSEWVELPVVNVSSQDITNTATNLVSLTVTNIVIGWTNLTNGTWK